MTLILGRILKEKGITSKALIDAMNQKGYSLSAVSISNIINNKHSPKLETLEQIADSLDMPLAEMFEGFKKPDQEPIYKKDDQGQFVQIGFLLQ